MKNLKVIFRKIQYRMELDRAYRQFQKTGKTSESDYRKFRKMFVITKGSYNDLLSEKINKKVGKTTFKSLQGVLGALSPDKIQKIGNALRTDGFYMFDALLPTEKTKAIYNFAHSQPANYLDVEKNEYSSQEVYFDENNIVGPRYNFSREVIFKSPELQELIFDDTLNAVAQEYLGCRPILDHFAFWWSTPYEGKGKSKAAQMYHFDMDRIKFIKFFFYLTDVTSDTGPHTYVKGSHRTLPAKINRDGRFSDSEIEAIFGREKCIEIIGKKGSVMAVDTRGLHKGKELLKGKRLLFQIEFANSMFGREYAPLDRKLVIQSYQRKSGEYSYDKIFK